MPSKPVVAMVLPANMHPRMFWAEDLRRLEQVATVLAPVDRPDVATLAPLLKDADVAIAGWGAPRFDVAMLANAPKLRYIAYSAGTIRFFATDELFARGIRISTSAAANATPVAEFTVAMMVSLLKQVPWLPAMYARGEPIKKGWPIADVDARRIRELRDMTVGLLGASRVGREVIRLLEGYPRLTVKVYDPYVSAEQMAAMGVIKASLEEACACEVVSVHAPNIPETRHMLNARTLALLPDHAVLINTARGALIDEAALVAEVRRRPLYVLLDVTDLEPPAPDSPLRTEPHIILTPHIAGAMHQARHDMGRIAIEETMRFLSGAPLQHEVTAGMMATQA